MTLDEALKIVRAAGYKVSKPKWDRLGCELGLNAIGKPYNPNYDPNYKMRVPRTLISRLLKSMRGLPMKGDK